MLSFGGRCLVRLSYGISIVVTILIGRGMHALFKDFRGAKVSRPKAARLRKPPFGWLTSSPCKLEINFVQTGKTEVYVYSLTLPGRGYRFRGLEGRGGLNQPPPLEINEGVVSDPRLLYRSLT